MRHSRAILAALSGSFLLVWAAEAQAPALVMFASLEKGSWTLRLGGDSGEQRVCLREARDLIQLRHPQVGCSRFVVQDTRDEIDVQYTCRGHGYGRTWIRRESKGLVQIRSRGIVDGAPFAIDAEGRHTGAC